MNTHFQDEHQHVPTSLSLFQLSELLNHSLYPFLSPLIIRNHICFFCVLFLFVTVINEAPFNQLGHPRVVIEGSKKSNDHSRLIALVGS